jgi:hypothetical protein
MMNGAHHMLIKRSINLLELSQELRIFKRGGLELSAIIIFASNEIAAVSLLCFAWFKPV